MSEELTEERADVDPGVDADLDADRDVATDLDTDATTDAEDTPESRGDETDLAEPDGAEDEGGPGDEVGPEHEVGAEHEVGSEAGSEPRAAGSRVQRLEAEGEIAADYLEELLDIADLDGDLDMDVEGDRAAVSIVGADLSQLVGRDGEVLDALQELTRLAVNRETGERSRLMLDVSGFRAKRRAELEQLAAEKIAEARETSSPVALQPMSSFERKVVHDAVAAAGLASESEGAEPRRFVVIQAP